MKTNSKTVQVQIKQHILDCMHDVNENEFNTFKHNLCFAFAALSAKKC